MNTITQQNVLTALQGHIGANNGVAIEQLTAEIVGTEQGARHSTRKVRKAIEQLRLEGHHICSRSHRGYYIAATVEELEDTVAQFEKRIRSEAAIVHAMRNKPLFELSGQKHLADVH